MCRATRAATRTQLGHVNVQIVWPARSVLKGHLRRCRAQRDRTLPPPTCPPPPNAPPLTLASLLPRAAWGRWRALQAQPHLKVGLGLVCPALAARISQMQVLPLADDARLVSHAPPARLRHYLVSRGHIPAQPTSRTRSSAQYVLRATYAPPAQSRRPPALRDQSPLSLARGSAPCARRATSRENRAVLAVTSVQGKPMHQSAALPSATIASFGRAAMRAPPLAMFAVRAFSGWMH